MRAYLSHSIASMNRNKLNGLLAEIDLRQHLESLGFGHRVSVGGWIARSTGAGNFGHNSIVVFPQIVQPDVTHAVGSTLQSPPIGLHTICSTFRQLGIQSFYCVPEIDIENDTSTVSWNAKELGIPWDDPYRPFPLDLTGFQLRRRRYNFLRYNTDVGTIPTAHLAEEFWKEHLRVALNTIYMAEVSDVDGIFWGRQYTYPIEVKEKTVANDSRLGDYFGLDLGPFVKLAHYAAKRGNLHSLFVVREIVDVESRELINWRYITFDQLAQFASWVPASGGTNMMGGGSTVVKIPKCEFETLTAEALAAL
jgi:hypothetical protein